MKNSSSRFAQLINTGMVSFILLSLGMRVSPTYARPATDDPPQKAMECLGDLQGAIFPTTPQPQTIKLWETVTLKWNVIVPSSCTGSGVKLYVDNKVVSPTGSQPIQPIADTIRVYRLHAALPAVLGGGKRTLATTTVDIKVTMPSIITISANNMAPLLLQALRFEENKDANEQIKEPDARRYIFIENQVELNLSGLESILIAGGVTLMGKRTALQPRPRLYTTIRPKELFVINGDNVRISNLRIEGPDRFGVVREEDEPEKGVGILDYAHINIEIDNNEIYGWSQSAIRVNEFEGNPEYSHIDRMLPSENPNAVRIHDNYIHHNQHQGRNGYGVAVYNGAYVLIERNVFDWNRHAIAGDGSPGTGYAAYRNLVLQNGGYHDSYNACDLPLWLKVVTAVLTPEVLLTCLIPGKIVEYDYYTHQFDMHGMDTCQPGHHNCGTAGHSMYIRHNTFLYTRGDAIKLRGTPSGMQQLPNLGMFVTSNVFAHEFLRPPGVLDVDPLADPLFETAIEQTETGLIYSNNLLGINGLNELGTCDFDGDGLNDSFLATGQTWWYSSGGDKPWVYLNTSTKRLSDPVSPMTLNDVNGDNICDVKVDGIVYPGGRPPTVKPPFPPGGGVLQ